MATETQRQRLRLDLGLDADDAASLTDTTIDALYVEVGESYSDTGSIHAATRVIMLERLLMQAAADVDYTQNNTTEKASQRFTQLRARLEDWRKKLDDAVLDTTSIGAARFGRTKHKPARIKEYPGTWGW